MILHRVLEAPLPFVAALALQAPTLAPAVTPGAAPVLVPEGPAWFLGLLSGGWLVVYVLDKLGKLPGKQGDATRADFGKLDRVHELLATEDEGGMPRISRHIEDVRDAIERQAAYIEGQRKLEALMQRQVQIGEDHNQLTREHHQLVGLVTDQLRGLHQKLDSITRRGA